MTARNVLLLCIPFALSIALGEPANACKPGSFEGAFGFEPDGTLVFVSRVEGSTTWRETHWPYSNSEIVRSVDALWSVLGVWPLPWEGSILVSSYERTLQRLNEDGGHLDVSGRDEGRWRVVTTPSGAVYAFGASGDPDASIYRIFETESGRITQFDLACAHHDLFVDDRDQIFGFCGNQPFTVRSGLVDLLPVIDGALLVRALPSGSSFPTFYVTRWGSPASQIRLEKWTLTTPRNWTREELGAHDLPSPLVDMAVTRDSVWLLSKDTSFWQILRISETPNGVATEVIQTQIQDNLNGRWIREPLKVHEGSATVIALEAFDHNDQFLWTVHEEGGEWVESKVALIGEQGPGCCGCDLSGRSPRIAPIAMLLLALLIATRRSTTRFEAS